MDIIELEVSKGQPPRFAEGGRLYEEVADYRFDSGVIPGDGDYSILEIPAQHSHALPALMPVSSWEYLERQVDTNWASDRDHEIAHDRALSAYLALHDYRGSYTPSDDELDFIYENPLYLAMKRFILVQVHQECDDYSWLLVRDIGAYEDEEDEDDE